MDAEKRNEDQDVVRLMKEKDDYSQEIAALKQELEKAKKAHEERCLEMEKDSRNTQQKLEERLKDVESLLKESKNRGKELETFSESKSLKWSKKENVYQIFTEFQLGALRVCFDVILLICSSVFRYLSHLIWISINFRN